MGGSLRDFQVFDIHTEKLEILPQVEFTPDGLSHIHVLDNPCASSGKNKVVGLVDVDNKVYLFEYERGDKTYKFKHRLY